MSEPNDDLEKYFFEQGQFNTYYRELVFWFCSHGHHFSLSCRDGIDWSLRAYQVLEELEPFLLAKEQRSWWPGVQLRNTCATIYFYRCEEGAADVLTKHASSFDEWTPVGLPEDLSFYRENDYWMLLYGTIHSVLFSTSEYEAFEMNFPGLLTPHSAVE